MKQGHANEEEILCNNGNLYMLTYTNT